MRNPWEVARHRLRLRAYELLGESQALQEMGRYNEATYLLVRAFKCLAKSDEIASKIIWKLMWRRD